MDDSHGVPNLVNVPKLNNYPFVSFKGPDLLGLAFFSRVGSPCSFGPVSVLDGWGNWFHAFSLRRGSFKALFF